MTTDQQREALSYFRAHARDWHRKASAQDDQRVNVIRQRNQHVLDVLAARGATRKALDVGCGTGELVCEIARSGIEAIGVDFADEMIAIARSQANKQGLTKARFVCCSIFDYRTDPCSFDLISANGFIEYLSIDEMLSFFDLVYRLLSPGGSFVVGSRNRLFNIFSLNQFTRDELSGGALPSLMHEAITLGSGAGLNDLRLIEPAPLQQAEIKHPQTGVTVATRYQYTPRQLIEICEARGLRVEAIYPIHIHGTPPAFKNAHPEVHAAISNLLQEYATESTSLVPCASSFMIDARKED